MLKITEISKWGLLHLKIPTKNICNANRKTQQWKYQKNTQQQSSKFL